MKSKDQCRITSLSLRYRQMNPLCQHHWQRPLTLFTWLKVQVALYHQRQPWLRIFPPPSRTLMQHLQWDCHLNQHSSQVSRYRRAFQALGAHLSTLRKWLTHTPWAGTGSRCWERRSVGKLSHAKETLSGLCCICSSGKSTSELRLVTCRQSNGSVLCFQG